VDIGFVCLKVGLFNTASGAVEKRACRWLQELLSKSPVPALPWVGQSKLVRQDSGSEQVETLKDSISNLVKFL
jgi:hypothetical protein